MHSATQFQQQYPNQLDRQQTQVESVYMLANVLDTTAATSPTSDNCIISPSVRKVNLLDVPTNTQLTPEDMPDWENLNGCSQIMYLGATQLINVLECGTWLCVCEHFPQAMSAAQSLASSYCGPSDTQDIAAATSVLNALCSSISATVSEPAGPTTDSVGECIQEVDIY
jgi:hypothetical protein